MQITKKLWRMISSTRLALYLLSAITLAATAGMLTQIAKGPLAYWYTGIPFIKTLGLDNVFATRWFLALSLVFLANTAACTVNQVKKAGRHRILYWGSPVFHAGLVITVLGVLISQGVRMSGKFIVGEGQVFSDAHQNYVTLTEGPFFGEDHGAFQVALDKVAFGYSKKGLPETISSRITVIRNGVAVKTGSTDFNKPLTAGNLKLYQYSQFGYTTGLRVLDREGKETARFRTVLETKFKPAAYEFTGRFQIPGSGDFAEARFYPAVDPAALKPRKNEYKPRNPGLALTIIRGDKTVYRGLLTVGKTAEVGEYRLLFDHFLTWSGITVVRDPGIFAIYTGFWTAVAGLSLMYLMKPKSLIRKGDE